MVNGVQACVPLRNLEPIPKTSRTREQACSGKGRCALRSSPATEDLGSPCILTGKDENILEKQRLFSCLPGK